MTATEELRRLLDECEVEWTAPNSILRDTMTCWTAGGFYYEAFEVPEPDGTFLLTAAHQDDLTPSQAIAVTLESDGEYERKMDSLLCRLTNGLFSKTRAYSLDFMESCVEEAFEAGNARQTSTTHAVIVSDESTDCATGHCECELCGQSIDPWDRFCRHCGAKVVTDG